MGSAEHIDVLIVTAADFEDEAVRAVTTGATQPWRELPPDERPEGYTFSIWTAEFAAKSGRPLRMALTRTVSMGSEAAAFAAAAFNGSHAPRCLAMCGVCAGRPGWTELGDVIIADRVYRYDVGELVNSKPRDTPEFRGDLITYPFRPQWKQSAERFTIQKDVPWMADRPLLRAAQEAWILSELWNERNPLAHPDRKGRCPDWAEIAPLLLRGGWIELDDLGVPRLTSAGRKRAGEMAFEHPDGVPKPPPFRVHVGPFATGSNLVRDVDIWERLQANQRLIRGLDMEASVIGFSALVQDRPWIVAKGVMDFAEPGRSQGFRQFAARAAAEVLIGFLRENLEPSGPRVMDVLRLGTAVRPPSGHNPATLLTARYEAVRFVESVRATELGTLQRWCEAPDAIGVQLVTGAGGIGKTRLFIELAKRLREARWDAGFLPETSTESDERLVLGSAGSTLVIVDYAETRRELPRLLARAGAQRVEDGCKLRIVLLARGIADWWHGLLRGASPIVDLLRAREPLELRPDDVPLVRRREVLEQSMEELGTVLGAPRAGNAPESKGNMDLSHPRFGRVLYLTMAALAALEGGNVGPESLLHDTLEHEKRYFELHFGDATTAGPGKADLVRRFVRLLAVATLRGGISTLEEAHRLSRGVRGPDEALVLDVLNDLYGTSSAYIAPLEPDLLGEELVNEVLNDPKTVEDYLDVVFDGAGEGQLFRGFYLLGRLATRGSDERYQEWLAKVLRRDVNDRAPTALDAGLALAQESAHNPFGLVLHKALEQHGSVEVAKGFLERIPHETVALRELACWATATVLASLSADATEKRAPLLNDLGYRLNALGRVDEALAAGQDAVQHYRKLAAARPDEFISYLVGSCNNVGNWLSALGRHEEALTVTHEAAQHCLELAKSRPDAVPSEFAGTFSNLSGRLIALGRREEALGAAIEAVQYHRKLAATRPDEFRPGLAHSLNNLGAVLGNLRRHNEALAPIEEAVQHYSKLAEARPDAFLPDQAMSLNNLAVTFGALGRHQEALEAVEKAVRHRRALAALRPNAFIADLSLNLSNFANMLCAAGRHKEALLTAQEAVQNYRDLASTRRDAFLPALAKSLSKIANVFSDLGRHEEALFVAQEAVQHYRDLANTRPDVFLSELALNLNNVAASLSELMRREESLAALEESVHHYRKLAERHPEDFLSNLVDGLMNLGSALRAVSRHEEGRVAVQEAHKLRRGLFGLSHGSGSSSAGSA
jgi:tetratricopeptide (TPR) repeat protein/nucleoside phosphorylase